MESSDWKTAARFFLASGVYNFYPGYGDFNISLGAKGLGITGGVLYDTDTGNVHLYFGGRIMPPGLSAALTVSTPQSSVSEGLYWGIQASNGFATNIGSDLKLNAENSFMEYGIGKAGASLSVFYVFSEIASTGNLELEYIAVEQLGDIE